MKNETEPITRPLSEKELKKLSKNYVSQLLMNWTFMITQRQFKNTKMKSLILKTLKMI